MATEHLHVHWFGVCCLGLLHRFTELDDYRWFAKTIERVAEEELGSKYHSMVKKDDYFVDFLRYHCHCTSFLPSTSFDLLSPSTFVFAEMLPNPRAKSRKTPI